MGFTINIGDCRTVLETMGECSVDAVVTDPPYELGFMGKSWDKAGVSYEPATWSAVHRVLKPGGHLLAFGGSRTFHRIAVAIEDAGFEIRDTISWLYGSGFPKSHDIGKAVNAQQKLGGCSVQLRREAAMGANYTPSEVVGQRGTATVYSAPSSKPVEYMEAPTEDAVKWSGWGTALKPAWEPVIVARKRPIGTIAENVLAHQTGAMNIEACRIPATDGYEKMWDKPMSTNISAPGGANFNSGTGVQHVVDLSHKKPSGRWPANVILDEDSARMIDEQAGSRGGGYGVRGGANRTDGDIFSGLGATGEVVGYGDSGGPSRFFYCPKASKSERNFGVPQPDFDTKEFGKHRYANFHPTVKPIELMRYLCRLVTPTGGVVLDPFMGSGSTGCAALMEGFSFIGVEREEAYAEIARNRLEVYSAQQLPMGV